MTVGYVQGGVGVRDQGIAGRSGWPLLPAIRGLRFEAHAGDLGYQWKRSLDVMLAGMLLLLCLPLIAVIALLIRLDSPGPIFVGQDRIGRQLRPFRMLKFRSMVADAELRLDALRHLNQTDGPIFKMRRDPRITRIGLLLRPSSLDE